MALASECYDCLQLVRPQRILPPEKKRGRVTRNQHSCNAPDCIGRERGYRGARRQGLYHSKSKQKKKKKEEELEEVGEIARGRMMQEEQEGERG